jgi:hypothetical protein
MKHITRAFASVLTLSALVVGCGPNPKAAPGADPATELSANELARLQDFHAWKLPVPESQQPLQRVNLVLVRADGTSELMFGTAYTDPAPAWTNILLGFRYEAGGFVGRLEGRGPKNGVTYNLNFTNASAEHHRSWAGSPHWNGNRAELATFWTSQEAAKSGGNDYSTLAVELVK